MELAKHLQLFVSIDIYPFQFFLWNNGVAIAASPYFGLLVSRLVPPINMNQQIDPEQIVALEACPDGPFDGMTGESRKNLAKQLYRRHWEAGNGELGMSKTSRGLGMSGISQQKVSSTDDS